MKKYGFYYNTISFHYEKHCTRKNTNHEFLSNKNIIEFTRFYNSSLNLIKFSNMQNIVRQKKYTCLGRKNTELSHSTKIN